MNKGIVAVVIILLLLGGAWYLMQGKTVPTTSQVSQGVQQATGEVVEQAGEAMEETGAALQGEEIPVTIQNFAYAPKSLTVKKGTKVTWTNQDSVGHTVTSDSGTELDSELLAQGESFSYTFGSVGTFPYHCTPHPNMKATVVVTE